MKLGIVGAGMIVGDLLSFIQEIPTILLKGICSRPSHKGNYWIYKVNMEYLRFIRITARC